MVKNPQLLRKRWPCSSKSLEEFSRTKGSLLEKTIKQVRENLDHQLIGLMSETSLTSFSRMSLEILRTQSNASHVEALGIMLLTVQIIRKDTLKERTKL